MSNAPAGKTTSIDWWSVATLRARTDLSSTARLRANQSTVFPGSARPWVVATPGGDRLNPQIRGAEIRERAHQPGPLRLVFLGNLIPRKGLHTLIDALNRLPIGSYSLDVIGAAHVDLSYTKVVMNQIERFRLTPSIRFHNTLDDDALAGLLRVSHLMVVPSSYEGFGIVYLEGMGFGLPAFGSNQGAASEIIKSGENGFLLDPRMRQDLQLSWRTCTSTGSS